MRPSESLPARGGAVQYGPPVIRYGRPSELPLWTPPPKQADIYDVVRRIWRHRGLVLLCTIMLGAVSLVAARMLPTYYIANARVQVGVPDLQIFASERRVEPGGNANEKVETERIAIQSRGLVKQVVDRLQLAKYPEFNPTLDGHGGWFGSEDAWRDVVNAVDYFLPGAATKREVPTPPDPKRLEDQLIDAVLARVDVSTLGRSQVLNVQVSSRDPKLAAAIANTLADVYRANQKNDKTIDSNRIEGYLGRRIAELREQVNKSDRAVAEYRKKYGLYQGTNASVTSQQLTELNTRLTEAQTAKAEAESRLNEAETLKKRGASGDALPDVLNSPVIQQLRAQQAEAERNLAELSSNLGPRHPKIITARAAVADLSAKIRGEIGRDIDGLRHQARTAEARYEALQKNFDRLKTEAGGVNEQNIDLAALERDATVNANLLEAMLNRAKETLGREEIDQPDAKVISIASPPHHASYPPKTLIVLLGTVAGGLIGSLAALMRDGFDRTFRRADEVEQATGLPVVSMVPTLNGRVRPTIQVVQKPVSTYSESLRKIYIGLQLSARSETPKTILFSSSTPSEGKSVMAASLGRMLAMNGKRVLLVDCDWRSPSLHRIFQCSNRYGLAQLVFEDEVSLQRAIFNDPVSGADVLVSGGWTPRASEMLMSDRINSMFSTFAKKYDLVILDSAPVLVSAEVLVLSRLVDKTVFVIRWGHTKQESALDALRQLNDAQADVAGIVMSRVDAKRYKAFAYDHLNYDYGSNSLARVA
ncbi:MAG TPA: polysaccharide biosynthesis tyrosine autokinase [Stellaceae bacterium]|nr:polysaccharide biosynthesis tyrosine autokinase [Stellaceae bacterium]